jgi:TRAP-type C4-dicarboxylate transport system substrate-binding protein
MSLSEEDQELILTLFDERMKLRRIISGLTNQALAEKFETSKAEIARLEKRGYSRDANNNRRSRFFVRANAGRTG